MSAEEALVSEFRALPPEKQAEVLDFVSFLRSRSPTRSPRRSLHGLCADLAVDVTEVDIAEARREMWAGFPRDDI